MRDVPMELLRYNLQYFADGPGGEKTEDATSKKLDDARKEGQVAKSQDLLVAAELLTTFLILKMFVGYIGERFLSIFRGYYGMTSTLLGDQFTYNTAHEITKLSIGHILLIGAPVYLASIVVAIVVNIFQVKWKPTLKPLMPKFNKLNPISGFKKIFSKDKVMELIKSIAKIGVIAYVVYNALGDQWGLLLNLYDLGLFDAIALIGETIIDLGMKISFFFLALGIFDLWYQNRKFKNDMKMSKQEVKDEYKQSEGDPHIKGKIRQKMREVSQRRMMQDLPAADVVITNPTHLAVAIKYDRDSAVAPIVIAKGADYLAQKIKEAAREHNIEIVENKPLARMIFYNVEIGDEIPPELYQMVAEILAYVYGIKGKL